mgnify:CR=1 FL=1
MKTTELFRILYKSFPTGFTSKHIMDILKCGLGEANRRILYMKCWQLIKHKSKHGKYIVYGFTKWADKYYKKKGDKK